jgi:hypothetical protein
MRPFFAVGVKLIGILVLYWAFLQVAAILSSVRLFWTEISQSPVGLDSVRKTRPVGAAPGPAIRAARHRVRRMSIAKIMAWVTNRAGTAKVGM